MYLLLSSALPTQVLTWCGKCSSKKSLNWMPSPLRLGFSRVSYRVEAIYGDGYVRESVYLFRIASGLHVSICKSIVRTTLRLVQFVACPRFVPLRLIESLQINPLYNPCRHVRTHRSANCDCDLHTGNPSNRDHALACLPTPLLRTYPCPHHPSVIRPNLDSLSPVTVVLCHKH